ncbi:uncharacterized protein N0V89_001377 [Didymosphaeria variabile]|uniref:Uncharacterized protein n=1 Tax=Didymosphaeria variabile TaxID=1932322 RepID=A0A9W8XYA9_9PLEO|nr:uncharacterized protein N0V89_001377 [Didymosphaeria variabile]KAJ4360810.1 hypothetical protein N0V89_001377 [Didymosphaeria variabile]
MEKQNADQWGGVRLDVLAEAYMEVRYEMWRILGARVNENWQLVEQKVMENGLKNLTQAFRQAQKKHVNYDINPDSGIGICDEDEDTYEEPDANPSVIPNLDAPTRTPSGLSSRQYHHVSLPRLGPVPATGMAHASINANADSNKVMDTDAPGAASGTKKGHREQTQDAVMCLPNTSTDFLLLNRTISSNPSNNTDAAPSPSVESEGTLEAGVDEVDVRKELLVDRLMLQFYSIFDAQNSPVRQHQGSSESPGGSPSKKTTSNTSSSRRTTKHGRSFEEDDDDEGELAEHQRTPVACVIRMQEPLEGLTQEQVEQLKRRKSMFQAESEVEKWKIVYMICFPDTTPGDMPTPYYDNETSETDLTDHSLKDPTLAQYEAYMNRELPRKVRKELEIAIGKLFGPLEETLKNQLEGLIRNCQERLSRDFVKSKESAHERGLDATSELAGPSDSGTQPQIGATATPSVLAPYTVPMDSSFELWQGMDATFNLQTSTYPDSAYYSETNPLPSDPWWPTALETIPCLANFDPAESGMMNSLGSHWQSTENVSNPSYMGKGKGRADEATGD